MMLNKRKKKMAQLKMKKYTQQGIFAIKKTLFKEKSKTEIIKNILQQKKLYFLIIMTTIAVPVLGKNFLSEFKMEDLKKGFNQYI